MAAHDHALSLPRVVGRLSAAVALSAALGMAACRPLPEGCEHDSLERCLWEQGEARPQDGGEEGGAADPKNGGGGDSRGEWGELDRTLSDIVELMGPGLEWPLVDERARALCDPLDEGSEESVESEEPGDLEGAGDESLSDERSAPPRCPSPDAPSDDEQAAWACHPGRSVEINSLPLALEAGGGVVALTATEISGSESGSMLDFALARFDEWCADDSFTALDGKIHQEFHRCALPEGPYLVVGRFPCDLEADRWQVSIAIMDEG